MSLATLSLTLYYVLIHSSQLEFQNLDFSISFRSLNSKLWFKIWNSKIIYDTATLWASSCMRWLMSLTTLSLTLYYLWHNITCPFHSLLSARVSKFRFFSSHVVTYILTFDSRSWTRESDIIWLRYEFINACCGSCPSLLCLWHNITVPFHSFLSA